MRNGCAPLLRVRHTREPPFTPDTPTSLPFCLHPPKVPSAAVYLHRPNNDAAPHPPHGSPYGAGQGQVWGPTLLGVSSPGGRGKRTRGNGDSPAWACSPVPGAWGPAHRGDEVLFMGVGGGRCAVIFMRVRGVQFCSAGVWSCFRGGILCHLWGTCGPI